MAAFETAFAFMLANEDPKREYATVPDAPAGAHAISGINSAAFPSDFAKLDAMTQAERAPAVEHFYWLNFWNSWLARLVADDVAARIFDEAVNAGSETAVKLLQRALGAAVACDGEWGPATLQAANSADPVALLTAYRQARVGYYEAIAASKPELAKYLAEWRARASK